MVVSLQSLQNNLAYNVNCAGYERKNNNGMEQSLL